MPLLRWVIQPVAPPAVAVAERLPVPPDVVVERVGIRRQFPAVRVPTAFPLSLLRVARQPQETRAVVAAADLAWSQLW